MAEVIAAATMAISSATALFSGGGMFDSAASDHEDEEAPEFSRDSIGSLGSQTMGTELLVLKPTCKLSSSPAVKAAARRSSERRQSRMRCRSGNSSPMSSASLSPSQRLSGTWSQHSYSCEDDEDPPPLQLPVSAKKAESARTPAIVPAPSFTQQPRPHGDLSKEFSSKARIHSESKTASEISRTGQLTGTTVTTRVVCSFSDVTQFIALARDGASERVSIVGRDTWEPRSRLCIVQHLCLRTIGPMSQHQPQLVLVLARGNDGIVRHLSTYQVLGRTLGVEWARGVPTWSNRSPGLHVLQEVNEEGIPSCPAVFEAVPVNYGGQISSIESAEKSSNCHDGNCSRDERGRRNQTDARIAGRKMVLLHRGKPLMVNERGFVYLGNSIMRNDTEKYQGQSDLHNKKYRQLCYHSLFDSDVGTRKEPDWLKRTRILDQYPDNTIIFSLPPPVTTAEMECSKSHGGEDQRRQIRCVNKNVFDTCNDHQEKPNENDEDAHGEFHHLSLGGHFPLSVVADGALSWYLNGCVEYRHFRLSLREWMERTITNSDDADPDRSWQWPVEYLADAIIDLYPEFDFPQHRESVVKGAERVMFQAFWYDIVNGLHPPLEICARLSRNIGQAKLRDDIVMTHLNVGESGAAHELSRLSKIGTPSWNLNVLGHTFSSLSRARTSSDERSADYFLPAMVAAVALSAVPADTLLSVREALRSVYALGREGYIATTFYCAVEALLQLDTEISTADSSVDLESMPLEVSRDRMIIHHQKEGGQQRHLHEQHHPSQVSSQEDQPKPLTTFWIGDLAPETSPLRRKCAEKDEVCSSEDAYGAGKTHGIGNDIERDTNLGGHDCI